MEDRKIFKKRDFVGASVTTYLILLILFFINFNKSSDNDCTINRQLIVFEFASSANIYGGTCTQKFVNENFAMVSSSDVDGFGILKGTMNTKSIEAEWNF